VLKKLWSSGVKGKIAIAAGLLVTMCICCTLILAVTPSAPVPTPTPIDVGALSTSAVQTVMAEAAITATSEPTATKTPLPIIPTATTNVSDAAYILQIQAALMDFTKYLLEVSEYNQQMSENTYLVLDNDWKMKTGIALGMLSVSADRFRNITPPEKFAAVHENLMNLADETDLMTQAYAQGIDNIDPSAIERSMIHLKNMTTYMNAVTAELEKLNSAP